MTRNDAGLTVKSSFSSGQIAARAAALPVVTYPDLPVSEHRDEIAEAIQSHQVIVVAGETGSGKTTQIPKICLSLGRGVAGMIGHTQPRRIAARSVAERIADELGQTIGKHPGQVVGYQVRFTDEVGPTTLVKLMTDGILLNEIQTDPDLLRYDTIIVDEAHERSLNIDFILGYLAQLLPRRPDLKLIITSATIDSEKFAAHFGPDTPVIEVSGRTFPVEIRYLDEEDDEEDDLDSLLVSAVDELLYEPDGDILVFLPGERDIREAQQTLEGHLAGRVEVIPLFARLSAAEQQRIFKPGNARRIILSTNIAETSLTVPGIRFVIDPGLARISRFSNKTKVQRLPIEKVSQASANQRSGRAGRVAPGIAIRLYSEEDFAARPEYTEPEILRTSLASVILQMKALGLGEVQGFPFIDPPSRQAVRDGVQLLVELRALTDDGDLTGIGRKLARLPIDPRLGRMLLASDKAGCASEVLVIVAALSMQDVRERPLDNQNAADAAHARFNNPDSDFLTYLNLWRYLNVQDRELSHSAFRRMCRKEFLHFLRWREWRDIVRQLRSMCKEIGVRVEQVGVPDRRDLHKHESVAEAVVQFGSGPRSVDYDQVHQSLLVGLLSNVGNWDPLKSNYQGARGSRFTIWPGSGLTGQRADWVMSAELVETSRLFARTVARIKPEWIENVGSHLIRRTYAEPYWSRARGAALIKERVLLYGLTIAADRSVLLGRLGNMTLGNTGARKHTVAAPGTIAAIAQGLFAKGDGSGWVSGIFGEDKAVSASEMAHEMFIRNALVEGKWRADYLPFVRHNRSIIARAEEAASRRRSPALVAGEEELERFFEERVPERVISAKSFEGWWKKQKNKHLLDLSWEDVFQDDQALDPSDFPDFWEQGSLRLKLDYPAGFPVSVQVPLSLLPSVQDTGFDWLVPGLLDDLCTATIRSLPKQVRRQLAPAPEAGAQIADYLREPNKALKTSSVKTSASQAESKGRPAETKEEALAASLARLSAWGQKSGTVSGASKSGGAAVAMPKPPTTSDDQVTSDKPKSPANRDFAEASLPETASPIAFADAFAQALKEVRGIEIDPSIIDPAALPTELQLRFQVIDGAGKVVDQGPSLALLQRKLSKKSEKAVSGAVRNAVKQASSKEARKEVEKRGLTEFPNVMPQQMASLGPGQQTVRGYPALVDRGTVVDLLLRSTLDLAEADHKRGVARLLLNQLRLATARITTRWTGREALMLTASPYPSTQGLVEDAQWAAALALAKPVRTRAEFDELVSASRDLFEDCVYQNMQATVRALETGVSCSRLLYPGFLSETPPEYLPHLPRYLKAEQSDLKQDPKKKKILREVETALKKAEELAATRPFSLRTAGRLERARWAVEELRVSLFAQQLGTSQKVSRERLLRQIDAIFSD